MDDLSPRHPGVYANRTPDRTAIVMARGGQTMSYAELEAVSNSAAHLFRRLGLVPEPGPAEARADAIDLMLEDFGLEPERFRLEWVSASEGQRFAEVITEMVEDLKDIGPSPYAPY